MSWPEKIDDATSQKLKLFHDTHILPSLQAFTHLFPRCLSLVLSPSIMLLLVLLYLQSSIMIASLTGLSL